MSLVPAVHTPCPVPADFDQKAYLGVGTAAGTLANRPAWKSYASGFNGVAFRFAAADEAHDRFIEAASGEYAFALGTSARYAQETALFSFFINTLSTIECFYFALYNIGACMNSAMFPSKTEDDLRRVSIPETVRRFKNAYPGRPLSKRLLSVRDSEELDALKVYRDFLTHRGTPPRGHDLGVVAYGSTVDVRKARSVTIPSNPKDVPSNWKSDLSLRPEMTAEPREWLAKTTNLLLQETEAFLQRP